MDPLIERWGGVLKGLAESEREDMAAERDALRARVAELEAALRGLMDHACLCYRGTCVQCEAVRKLVEVP